MFCISNAFASFSDCTKHKQAHAAVQGHTCQQRGLLRESSRVSEWREQKPWVPVVCSVEHSRSITSTKWVCCFKENKIQHTRVKSLSLQLFLHHHCHKQEFVDDPLYKRHCAGPSPEEGEECKEQFLPSRKAGWWGKTSNRVLGLRESAVLTQKDLSSNKVPGCLKARGEPWCSHF